VLVVEVLYGIERVEYIEDIILCVWILVEKDVYR
jgi:hypothetical protein